MSGADPRSARVESVDASHLVGTGKGDKSAGESLDQYSTAPPGHRARRAYVTRSRAAVLGSQLNRRHWAVTVDVGRLGVLSGRQVQRLHYGASAAGARLARKHLGQLIAWRVLERLDRSVGGVRAGSSGFVYVLGPTGQRLLEPGRNRYRQRWTPRPRYLRHALAVSELYTALREQERSTAMELISFTSEPGCWRRYFGPGGAPSILKPDALAVVGSGDFEDRYYCELDCGTEHRPHILAKAKTYVRYWQSGREQAESDVFPFVLWIAPDARRASFLVDILASLHPEHWQLFLVTTAGEVAQRMASGNFAPTTNRKEVR